jgi:hypothetical protein
MGNQKSQIKFAISWYTQDDYRGTTIVSQNKLESKRRELEREGCKIFSIKEIYND